MRKDITIRPETHEGSLAGLQGYIVYDMYYNA